MRGRGGLRFRWASVARSEDAAKCMYDDGFVFYCACILGASS